MIEAYHRPDSVDEALALLARQDVHTLPLAGGTFLSQSLLSSVALVDLQSLGLDTIQEKGNKLEIGATVSLQQLLDFDVYLDLKVAVRHEATYNIRQAATVAGTLVSADGRSPFATAMLALDAELYIMPEEQEVNLGDYLFLRSGGRSNQLIIHVTIPRNVKFGYEYVARTPADLPIVCVAVSQWPSGRTRVAIGGYGDIPILAMDGPESDGAVSAAQSAYQEASDQWASAEYRNNVVGILASRCMDNILDL
ncbi:MAG: FAD binding domain-containing protein [Anaerolineales bacterium]|jgi:CO/xanthine dehydrogenase FAD-binding subunit